MLALNHWIHLKINDISLKQRLINYAGVYAPCIIYYKHKTNAD